MPEVVIALLAALVAVVVLRRYLFGFAAQRSDDYSDTLPCVDIRAHLSGPLICEGVIFGPTGRVVSRFVADMQGEWAGDRGTLHEEFRFASGKVQQRAWHLEVGQAGAFSATAADVIGQARGQQSGASVSMRYRLRLEREAGGHVLDVTDWIYLMENGTLINRTEMRKFGIKVGELVATMRRA